MNSDRDMPVEIRQHEGMHFLRNSADTSHVRWPGHLEMSAKDKALKTDAYMFGYGLSQLQRQFEENRHRFQVSCQLVDWFPLCHVGRLDAGRLARERWHASGRTLCRRLQCVECM